MAKRPRRNTPKVSEPQYKVRKTEDVHVVMPDGVRIALCIWQPDADGEFPTLYAASPYQWEYDHIPADALFPWRETGPVEWYVARGYVYIHADVRGSGRSEGEFGFLSKTEQEDNFHVIEWIAKQPWSNGRVGGIGQSYFGFSQWLMAAMNPPHLTCIAPYDALFDPYRCHGFHGGIYCAYRTNWYTSVRANALHRSGNRRPGKLMEFDLGLELTRHDTYDDWWRERTAAERADRIKIPVFSIGHWAKMGLHLRGNLVGFEEIETDKKLLVTGCRNPREVHQMFDTIEFHETELLPFYDHYLKGYDSGYDKRAPVRIFVRGEGQLRDEKEWPLKRARQVSYYLRKGPSGSVTSINDGGLSTDKPGQDEGSTSYAYPDPEWTNGVAVAGPDGPDPVRRVLTFTTDELADDVEVTGPIVLELHASSDQIDTDFIVKVADQEPQSAAERKKGAQPKFTNVSKGWLKASHHTTKNAKKSTPLRPFYDHDDPRPLEPGRDYKFEIEVLPTSYLFKKGHRIRLEVVNGDSFLTDAVWTHPYHPDKMGSDTIHHDAARPSRLLLPVVARGKRSRK